MTNRKDILLQTERLYLRHFYEDDFDNLYLLSSNENVMRFFPEVLDVKQTKELLNRIIESYGLYGHCFWAAFLKDSDTFIGMCGLLHQKINHRVETEIAYRILDDYWNQGFATESAIACKNYAFHQLGKNRVISLIRPDNIPSKRVALKTGLTLEAKVLFQEQEHELYSLNNHTELNKKYKDLER
ncbi:Protein N-acetyltransferase, RimJ/RimL family [Natronincola peptidivorans]|uniref:Protein N-acetyltransferase, RimJ/RimL family n=1 Tax=Natronincola peptidivorans TaxID=426128 RepID=A0A1I0CG17_9FIRM|nr:GNAT family N-acetyltransferase [Natronincola peptidivorans]SET18077.1 Protein N-acetyltransferase, RimJ/RimL family [Natronincola peptidivorans]